MAVDEPGLLLDLRVQAGKGRVGLTQLTLDICEARGQGLPATAGPLECLVELLLDVASACPKSELPVMKPVAFCPEGLELLDGPGVLDRDRLG